MAILSSVKCRRSRSSSADFQSAVSPTCSRLATANRWHAGENGRLADCKSAIQQSKTLRYFSTAAVLALVPSLAVGCAHRGAPQPAQSLLLTPAAPEMNRRAPDAFRVRLETSKGPMLLEAHRDWSPHGADRFYNLVRAGFYDEARFFRVIAGRWAQFGINGDPRVARLWHARSIPDDPRVESNVRGTVAYAFTVPNGRTTQVFINLRDNSATHDPEPFVPFGRVVEGMDVADVLDAEYGESAGGGIRGGKQAPVFEGGNQYLKLTSRASIT